MADTYLIKALDSATSQLVTYTVANPNDTPVLTSPPVSDVNNLINKRIVKKTTIGTSAAIASLAINFLAINTMTGTVPRLVGSIILPTGTYQAPSALLGAGDPAYTATLTLETPTGDVIATVGGVAGGVAWRTSTSGFALAAETAVDLVLVCSAAHQPAFIHGININKV